jgi:hypothetical protein
VQVGKDTGGLASPCTDIINGPGEEPIRLLIVAIPFTGPPGKGVAMKSELIVMLRVTGNSNAGPVVTVSVVVVRSGTGRSGGPEAVI